MLYEFELNNIAMEATKNIYVKGKGKFDVSIEANSVYYHPVLFVTFMSLAKISKAAELCLNVTEIL